MPDVPSERLERFPFAWTSAYRLAAAPWGITPARSWVALEDDWLEARFGPWRLRTPLGNIVEVERTGPFGFAKTAGPPHLGLTDRGLTFASNGSAGLRLGFEEPVAGIEPTGLLRHPELTVTVADIAGLVDRCAEHLP